MGKQYFLLVKDYTGINCKPVEVAVKNLLMRQLHQKVWDKGEKALFEHIEQVMAEKEKEYRDTIHLNFIEDKPTEEDLNYLCFGLFRVRGYEVRNANPRYHVQMPANWMALRYKDWTRLTIREQNERFHTEMKKVEGFINSNQHRTLITSFLNEYEGWKIELIDFTHPQYQELAEQSQPSKGLEPLEGSAGKEASHG